MNKIILALGMGLMVGAHAAVDAVDMEHNVATESNLAEFQLLAPELTDAEKAEVEALEKFEADQVEQQKLYDMLPEVPATLMSSAPRIGLELFQKADTVGKQFLLVRKDGKIKYAFAVSAGKGGTPRGNYGVTKMKWRHMSASYPSRGENNMDHVTYFKPLYGFHSTTFNVYSVLGTKASHGCVRLARPQARAVFSLIKAHGGAATVAIYGAAEPNPQDLRVIQRLLADDLNRIQDMIKSKNKGDVPFKEEQYYQYLAGQISQAEGDRMARAKGIAEIIEIDGGQDRYPRASRGNLQLR